MCAEQADQNHLLEIEVGLLLRAIQLRYGYDFNQYRASSITKSLTEHAAGKGYASVSEMIPVVLKNERAFRELFMDISIGTTEMFRTPKLYHALRSKVIPILKTYPYVNVWHAGCATGEEVYSMAILFKEEGLYDRTQFYATDINDVAIRKGKAGIYPLSDMKRNSTNYFESGGKRSLNDYYHTRYKAAKMNSELRENVTFSNHNLVTDGVFSEMHLVLCRNVMLYFNRDLQNRVLRLLTNSLCHNGFFCIGEYETLDMTAIREHYELIEDDYRIYRKKIPLYSNA